MIRRATMTEIRDELEKGRITESDLRDPHFHLDGYFDGGSQRVYVNPRPSVVETICHELIHRRWPKWTETRVDQEAKRLVARMTPAEVATFYARYQVLARKRKTPKQLED